MRQISIAIVVSLGLHAGSVWALRGEHAAQGPAPSPEPAVADAIDAVQVDSVLLDSFAAGVEPDEVPSESPAARRASLQAAKDREAAKRARQLERAAEAHREAARAKTRLRSREADVSTLEGRFAAQRDRTLSSEGRLRIARAPVDEAAAEVEAAEAAEARTAQEASVAEQRAEAAAKPPPPPPQARRAPQRQAATPPTTTADVVVNAAIARANAAQQQAKDAKAKAAAARRRHEANVAAIQPLAAAAAADAAALKDAEAALVRAEDEVKLAAVALREATERSDEETGRALALQKAPVVNPDEWVKLPGSDKAPAEVPADPAPRGPVATPAGDAVPSEPGGPTPTGAGAPSPASTPEPKPPAPPVPAAPGEPTATAPKAVAGSPAADPFAPLAYVRTASGTLATWDPNARVIGTNALEAPVATRAPTNVAPLDAIGPGQAPEARFEAPTPEANRATTLPPLRSDGPAPDGFVLSLLDAETPAAAPHTAERTPGGGETAVAPTHAEYEPDADPSLVDASEDNVSVLPDSVPEGTATLISVSGHPLAAWMDGVDEALRRGWDYPVEAQARGLRGTVEVSFRVSQTGRVSSVKVLRSDAPAELVLAATSSVPARFKPPPAGWGDIDIRYTYRYRGGS